METGKRTVLLVDDNPSVLLLMERALASEGYELVSASDGEEALRLAANGEGRLDLLVADLVLPRLGGLELASRLARRDPGLRVVLVSGYSGEEVARGSAIADRIVFLGKPFTASMLRDTVREQLRRREAGG